MRIGLIGSGDVGRVLGRGFSELGHDVVLGTRTPERDELRRWSEESGGRAGTFAEAAAHAELAVLATAWSGTENAIRLAGPEALAGKVVIDATNPLRYTDHLELTLGHTDSGGEQVQRWLPGARVVKAFNTVGWELMVRPSIERGPPTLFIAGDDDAAKQDVSSLAEALGWHVHDCGPLRAARYTEAIAVLWIEQAMRARRRDHAFALIGGS